MTAVLTEGEAPAPPTAGPRPMSFEVKLIVQLLTMIAIGMVGFGVYLLVLTPVAQSNDQDRLYAQFREQLAAETAPTGGLIDAGSPVALLTIPGLKLNDVVVEGTSSSDLFNGPGHRRDTPLPGQAGVSLLYGRSVTFGAPFAQIDRLRPGDRITATTGQGSFTYRVLGVRHVGDPIPAPVTGNAGRLTLETSTGSNPLQHNTTLLVDADLTDKAAPTPSGRPSLILPEEQAMASDASASVPLVLLLQALGLLIAGIMVARWRWGRREAVLLGVPIMIALLWYLFSAFAQLLPNLL